MKRLILLLVKDVYHYGRGTAPMCALPLLLNLMPSFSIILMMQGVSSVIDSSFKSEKKEKDFGIPKS